MQRGFTETDPLEFWGVKTAQRLQAADSYCYGFKIMS